MMAIVIFILILSFLVLIHEAGHFLAALWAGVKVEEFGLGYPPRAMKLFKWRGTNFTLNWVPFGGFVKLAGEEAPRENLAEKIAKKTGLVDKDLFYNKPAPKRLVVILAGVTVNFLFGILAFAIIFSIKGIPTATSEPIIAYVADNSPAKEAGLEAQSKIFKLAYGSESVVVANTVEVTDFIKSHQGQEITLYTTGHCDGNSCQEMAREYHVYLRSDQEIPEGEGSMGVAFASFIFKFYPWWQMPFRAMFYGLMQALFLSLLILTSLASLITQLMSGVIPSEIAGPVGIVHEASRQGIFEEGFLSTLNFTAMLSVNLAVMNLLPIPALDGGRAIFIFIEKLVGKKKSQNWESYANYAGYLILLTLIVLVTLRDISKLINF